MGPVPLVGVRGAHGDEVVHRGQCDGAAFSVGAGGGRSSLVREWLAGWAGESRDGLSDGLLGGLKN